MSEMIPLNWNRTKLLDLVETSQAGEWGDEPVGDHNDVFVLRSTNFTNSGIIDYSKLVVRNIAEKKRLSKLLKRGDIVLEKSGGSPSQPVGRVVYFDRDGDFLYSNFTQKITPSNVVDSKYFFYKLYFEYQNGLVLKFQQQTTGIINFQLSEYLNLRAIFPPKNEQQKIATILTTVDEVIESTAAQINKLKDLKTGMMQELLTKGIGRGGQPHTEFKDSPVGRIPKVWKTSFLSECVKIKNNLRKPINKEERECVKGIYPYYGPTKAVDYLNEYRVEGDHVLIGEDGDHFIKFSSWSMTQFVTGKFNVNNHAHILQGTELCLTKWIYYFFMHRDITPALTRQGATRYKLNKASLESLDIVLPPISEQGAIVKIFDSLLESLKASETKLLKLNSIKKSLMQDLLTGQVRVEVNQ